MVGTYTDEQLLGRVRALKSFKYMPDYLLIGVRSKADKFNEYDDKFYFYIKGEFIAVTTGTTNPGKNSLLGGSVKYNPKGAAVIKSDEIYYDVYEYGLHKNKMPALRQVGKMLYYRDGDNDEKTEEEGEITSGNFFTHFHFNNYDLYDRVVCFFINGWSFGCQVANMSEPYLTIINRVKKDKVKVSYALLLEF